MVESAKPINKLENNVRGWDTPMDEHGLDPAQSAAVSEERGRQAAERLSGQGATMRRNDTSMHDLHADLHPPPVGHATPHAPAAAGIHPHATDHVPPAQEAAPSWHDGDIDDDAEAVRRAAEDVAQETDNMLHAASGAANEDTDVRNRSRYALDYASRLKEELLATETPQARELRLLEERGKYVVRLDMWRDMQRENRLMPNIAVTPVVGCPRPRR